MSEEVRVHRNPSREACQKIIKRILVTEVLEKGKNSQFRTAADFMNYFQSLYPASDALTKQVQRAVKAMDMPKDEHGYFIINKTSAQMDEEKEIRALFEKYQVTSTDLSDCEMLFLSVGVEAKQYLTQLLLNSITFKDKVVTIQETGNGLILYTREKALLLAALKDLLPAETIL